MTRHQNNDPTAPNTPPNEAAGAVDQRRFREEGEKAWVTLATNDTYSLGALVLAHSLKKVQTSFKLVVLVSSNVSFSMRGLLQGVYDEVKEVNLLDSGDAENLRLLARPELGITFTKLHCWRLTQYEKCVFLDADTLVLQNCDELFERDELSAAPDVGWPDCFNSGVFVFKPSEETYQALIGFALTHGSFDGGDQGLLNMFFSGWATGDASKRLPFLFNLSSAAIYSYLPAFKWYGKGVKIVHFIGGSKPWLQPFNPVTRLVQTDHSISYLTNFLQHWWDIFCAQVYPYLSPEMTRMLLRSWITPQIALKNNSHQNMHSRINTKSRQDKTVLDTFDQTEHESHFVLTDPWDEYETSLVDNIDNDDCSNSMEYISPVQEIRIVPPVIHEVKLVPSVIHERLVENQCPPKLEMDSFQNWNDRIDAHKSVDNFAFSASFPQPSSNDLHSEISNGDYHQSRNNSEIQKPIISMNRSEQTKECSSTVNANNSSPSVVDVSPEEKEISSNVELNQESGLAHTLSQMKLEEPTPEQLAEEDLRRRLDWEQGNIDYMGKDSFDNIWSKISQSVSQAESPPATDVPDTASPTATTVSPTRSHVTPATAVSPSAASVPTEPTKKPASETVSPADQPKTETTAAPTKAPSSPSSDLSSSPDTVGKEAQAPVSQSPKEPPVTPSPKAAEPPVTPSQKESPVTPSQKEPPVTPSQTVAQPAITASTVPRPESAPVCVKPSPVEKQTSQSHKEAAPKESAPLQSPSQETKPATEPSSITPPSPKLPESPVAAEATRSSSTVDPVDPRPAGAEPPSGQEESKSKQTPKSGGGKKK